MPGFNQKIRSYLYLNSKTGEPILFKQNVTVSGKPWLNSLVIEFTTFDTNPINSAVFDIYKGCKIKNFLCNQTFLLFYMK